MPTSQFPVPSPLPPHQKKKSGTILSCLDKYTWPWLSQLGALDWSFDSWEIDVKLFNWPENIPGLHTESSGQWCGGECPGASMSMPTGIVTNSKQAVPIEWYQLCPQLLILPRFPVVFWIRSLAVWPICKKPNMLPTNYFLPMLEVLCYLKPWTPLGTLGHQVKLSSLTGTVILAVKLASNCHFLLC